METGMLLESVFNIEAILHILKAEGGKNMTLVNNRVVVLAQHASVIMLLGGSSDGGHHGTG
jgi:hypothetical protein